MAALFWLMKTEPKTFSIDDLEKSPTQTTVWEGVRNYQARNFMRDAMAVGDRVLIYHASTATPGVVGTAQISRAAYADATQFMPDSPYYDPKATPAAPRWVVVDVTLLRRFATPVLLRTLRHSGQLADMWLLQKGSRLSVQPVTAEQYAAICHWGQ